MSLRGDLETRRDTTHLVPAGQIPPPEPHFLPNTQHCRSYQLLLVRRPCVPAAFWVFLSEYDFSHSIKTNSFPIEKLATLNNKSLFLFYHLLATPVLIFPVFRKLTPLIPRRCGIIHYLAFCDWVIERYHNIPRVHPCGGMCQRFPPRFPWWLSGLESA